MSNNPNTGPGRNLTGDKYNIKPVRQTREKKSHVTVNGHQSTPPTETTPSRLEKFIRFLESLPTIAFRIAVALIALLLFVLWFLTEGSRIVQAIGFGSAS
jgi:hypothetical protein